MLNVQEVIDRLCHELATPPLISTLRVNTMRYSAYEGIKLLQSTLAEVIHLEILCVYNRIIQRPLSITVHPEVSDVLLIEGSGPQVGVVPDSKPVIVGLLCGLAVLRGAEVYAPGVMGAPKGYYRLVELYCYCVL